METPQLPKGASVKAAARGDLQLLPHLAIRICSSLGGGKAKNIKRHPEIPESNAI